MSKRTVPKTEHCGDCDPRTRQLEDAAGRPRRCPVCHPLVPRPQAPTILDVAPLDTDWMRAVRRGIVHLAESGVPFAAEHVAELGVGEPAHPNHWGVAFQAAHREGLISVVAVGPSPREQRRGGLRRLWTGAPEALRRPA